MILARLAAVAIVAASVSTWSSSAAQPAPGMHRIGFINSGPAAANATNVAALKAGLAELGYVEGRNLVIDFRWADKDVSRLPALVNELLALKPALLFSTGGAVTVRAVKAATSTVPVVFITGDPVAENIVSNLARPGGNLTGMAVLAGDLEAKRLEILKQMLPETRRVAVIWNPSQPYVEGIMRGVEEAARRLKIDLVSWKARNTKELEAAFSEIARAKADAFFVVADPVLGFERARIVQFANANRLPAIYFWREFVEIDGLASYGTSLSAVYRGAAVPVDKILKGAKPGDLPIVQPTTFEFIINLKTAKTLGIAIPPTVRQRADEVIE
jgi:putative ABC transport system substrate-binding protein